MSSGIVTGGCPRYLCYGGGGFATSPSFIGGEGQWRQREFNVGGRSAEGSGVWGAVPSPQKMFCFVISK